MHRSLNLTDPHSLLHGMKTTPPLALAALLLCSTAHPATRVLFCSDKQAAAGRFDLYTISAEGTDLQRLTTTPEISEWAPALAPDGRRLAYVAREGSGPTGTLWLTDLDGASPNPVTTAAQAMAVQWVSDTTLAFLGFQSNRWDQPYFDLRTVNTDGTGEKQVYAGPFWIWTSGVDHFTLHRATGRVYFSSTRESQGDFAVTPLSGLLTANAPDTVFPRCVESTYDPGEPATPGNLLADHYDLSVSPDGRWLAYAADHGSGVHRLYVREASGDCATQNRLSAGFCGDPVFAPDASFLVFTRAVESNYGIAPYIGNLIRINPDGSGDVDLTAALADVAGRCAHAQVYTSAGVPCDPFSIRRVTASATEGVRIAWPCEPGASYQVEYSEDFGAWRGDLPGSSFAATAGETELQFVDTSPLPTWRFYRVVATCIPK